METSGVDGDMVELEISNMAGMAVTLVLQGSSRLWDLKQRLAIGPPEGLGVAAYRQLLLNGDSPLDEDGKTLMECGVSHGSALSLVVKDTFRIVNVESGRCVFARDIDLAGGWERGVGAGAGPDYPDQHWKLEERGESLLIVNEHSGRRLYAQRGGPWIDGTRWEAGVGAAPADSETHPDQSWRLVPHGDGHFVIVNAATARRLFARVGHNWESNFGASPPDHPTVYPDQVWMLR